MFNSTPGAVFLTHEERQLRRDLEREAQYIRPDKILTHGVRIHSMMAPTAGYRVQIQINGRAHGCHSCGTDVATDPNQPWTGDHVPSTGLSPSLKAEIRVAKGMAVGETVLFPHCQPCSIKQAQVVKRYKATTTLSAVSSADRPFLTGNKPASPTECVDATGPRVTSAQRQRIQQVGQTQGCHCCGAKFPAPDYIADHVFPKELCTHYMEGLFEKLGLDYPTEFYLMPQCPNCSNDQGGTLSQLARRAQTASAALGVQHYKT